MYPKSKDDLNTLVGKVIVFNEFVEHGEYDYDTGMKCRVISADHDMNGDYHNGTGGTFKLTVDFSEFEEFNKSLMKPTYYDENHKPTLTWAESKYYPKNCQTHDYYSYDDGAYKDVVCFSVVNEENSFQPKDVAILLCRYRRKFLDDSTDVRRTVVETLMSELGIEIPKF